MSRSAPFYFKIFRLVFCQNISASLIFYVVEKNYVDIFRHILNYGRLCICAGVIPPELSDKLFKKARFMKSWHSSGWFNYFFSSRDEWQNTKIQKIKRKKLFINLHLLCLGRCDCLSPEQPFHRFFRHPKWLTFQAFSEKLRVRKSNTQIN